MKLSRKQSIRLSFLAHKLALALGHDERMALLTELLDELGVDQEQREDSRKSAQHHLHYEAAQRRKAAKKADSMNLDELQASNKEMLAKLKRLLEERRAEQPASTPEPEPIVEEAPQYTVTASQRRALARFDDLTDADQVDTLRGMWGAA